MAHNDETVAAFESVATDCDPLLNNLVGIKTTIRQSLIPQISDAAGDHHFSSDTNGSFESAITAIDEAINEIDSAKNRCQEAASYFAD